MERKMKSMDGNNAAAHVSYAFSEVAAIYPITPSVPHGRLRGPVVCQRPEEHLRHEPVKVVEMQSEAGAAGAVHGSLGAGALTTTYTASQGLLLMIPNMYKIAGELLPAVFHVSARTVATQALNIFGDHSDVMACRQTGFAMLCEGNPQEVMDLCARGPSVRSWRARSPSSTSSTASAPAHEIQKIAVWDYEDLKEMCDMDAVEAFRAHALNPEHPRMRGCHENGDIFFQHREACNKYYDALPTVVEKYMDKINAKLGTDYQLFNYYGAPDADRVIVAMGSICDVAEEVIDYHERPRREGGSGEGPPVPSLRPGKAGGRDSRHRQDDRRSGPHQGARRSWASPCTWMLSPLWPTPARPTCRSSAAATVWAPRIRLPPPSSPCMRSWRRRAEAPVHHRHRGRRDEPVPAGG